jgi:subtilisin family serine protease
MKKLLLILLCVPLMTLSQPSFAPDVNAKIDFNDLKSKLKLQKKENDKVGLSPFTRMFLNDLKILNQSNKEITKSFKRKYYVSTNDLGDFVGALVKVNKNIDEHLILNLGIDIGTRAGNIWTLRIPISKFDLLLEVKDVEYIEIDFPATTKLDNARTKTWVHWVHDGVGLNQSYFGNDVVVGIIDNGFDYTHPQFYDVTGQFSRIKMIWEQSTVGTNIVNPPGYSYGHWETNSDSILSWAYDRPHKSHGTHVTGIAAGGGVATNGDYIGVAPASDIVMVSTDTTLGIPLGALSNLTDAINVIFNYASSVNKPAVVNMSLGSHIGPHDGTSLFDVACDNLVGPGKILVGSAGNEGDNPLHIEYNFNAIDTGFWTCVGYDNPHGYGIIDIWGEQGKDFGIGIGLRDSITNQWVGTNFIYPSQDTNFYTHLSGTDGQTCTVFLSSTSSEYNGKPRVYITIQNATDNQVVMQAWHYGSGGKIHAWNHGTGYGAPFSSYGYSWAIDGNTDVTIGEIGGTGNSIISVGSYNSKNSWIDFTQNQQSSGDPLNYISDFSSRGPTVDGRIKPDITAPGNVIVSSVSSFDQNYPSTNWRVVAQVVGPNGGLWRFAKMQGTSMSSPMAAGIIALWLEVNPNLTPNQIKHYMNDNSYTDVFTGSVPNNVWGWGKIDAHESILDILNITSTPKELIISTHTKLVKIIDILGRETKGTKNALLFYIYDDGTVEKRIIVE